MATQQVNKVIVNGQTLIDISVDTVDAAHVLAKNGSNDVYFHLPDGTRVQGTCDYDSNTTDASAAASEILNTKTAYVNKTKVTGTMPNNGAVTGVISTVAGKYTIPQGYHDGSGTVSIDATEQSKLIATNIRSGVTVLGIVGSMEAGEGITSQTKSVTPTFSSQSVTPDTGTTYLSQVTVAAIPVTRTANGSTGGDVVTVG